MQTLDFVSVHNCLEFSQPLECYLCEWKLLFSGHMTKLVDVMYDNSLNFLFPQVLSEVSVDQALNKAMSDIYTVSFGPAPSQHCLTWKDLHLNYQQVWERIFQATCIEALVLPRTGTLNAVLSITPREGDPPCFTKTLSQISKDVLRQPYGQRVWKAITGPEDIPGQNDYRLSVEVEEASSSRVIPQQQGNFKVEQCTVETCPPFPQPQFTHTVRIRVSVI